MFPNKEDQDIVTEGRVSIWAVLKSKIAEDRGKKFTLQLSLDGSILAQESSAIIDLPSLVAAVCLPPGEYQAMVSGFSMEDEDVEFMPKIISFSVSSPEDAAKKYNRVLLPVVDQMEYPCPRCGCQPSNTFGHLSSGDGSRYLQFTRSIGDAAETVLFHEIGVRWVGAVQAKRKIAYILESPAVAMFSEHYIRANMHMFDFVMSCQQSLLQAAGKKGLFTSCGWAQHTWPTYPMQRWILHPKAEMVSLLASDHNFTAGHAVRHASWAAVNGKTFRNSNEEFKVVRYGRGYRLVDNPLEAIRNYRYSIVVENSNEDFYFTDKLILCFTVGTVPIFWGCPSIARFFDGDGIIQFTDPSQLDGIMATLSEEDYNSRIPAMKRNLEIAKKFFGWDDFIYENHPWIVKPVAEQPKTVRNWEDQIYNNSRFKEEL